MSLYALAKITHLISMIFFIAVVSFRTFIMPVLNSKYDKETYADIDKLTGKKARSIIKVNNLFLILSGLYLLALYAGNMNMLFYIKVSIGLVLALTFYIVPTIMKNFNHIGWFSQSFHYLFFSLMMVALVLSQLMFT